VSQVALSGWVPGADRAVAVDSLSMSEDDGMSARCVGFAPLGGFWTLVVAVLVLGCSAAVRVEAQQMLVEVGDPWVYFRGTEAPPDDWKELEFEDFDWEEGGSGFGYGDGDDATILDDMSGNYWTIFVRKTIELEFIEELGVLQFGVQYDDGYVAYLNGVEFARSASMGAAGGPAEFDTAAGDHEVNASPEWITLDAEDRELLQEGENVIAISVHNATLASSDCSLIPQLRVWSPSDLCPIAVTCRERSSGGVRITWRAPLRPPPYERVDILRDGEVIGQPRTPSSSLYSDLDPPRGVELTYRVVAYMNGQQCEGDENEPPECAITLENQDPVFRRGDSDDNGEVNLTDAVNVLNWLFQQGPSPGCQDAADSDDNGAANLTDAVLVLQHLFQQGAPPAAPGATDCGSDPQEDELVECSYESC